MKYYPFVIVILIIGNLFFGYYFYANRNLSEDNKLNSYSSLDNSATCYFNKTASSSYYGFQNNIEFTNFKDQKSPNVITITGLNTTNPTAKGNNGEEALIKIFNDDSTVLLASSEALNQGKLFSYSISKKSKVASWVKQYDILPGSPFALLSMGYCE